MKTRIKALAALLAAGTVLAGNASAQIAASNFASAGFTSPASGPYSINYTVANTNDVVVIGLYVDNGNSTINSLTYNGRVPVATNTVQRLSLFYFTNAPVGASMFSVGIAQASQGNCGYEIWELSGVNLSAPVASATGTDGNTQITTLAANSFIIDILSVNNGGNPSVPDGDSVLTKVGEVDMASAFGGGYLATGVTNKSAAGTYNLGWTIPGGGNYGEAALAFAPAAAVVTNISGTWTNSGDGNWSAGADWDSNPSYPKVLGDTATLGAGSAYTTVTLDTPVLLSTLNFTNANSFMIANAGNILTLTKNGAGATVSVTGGSSNVVAAAVALADNLTISNAAGTALTLTNVVSGSKTLTVSGSGKVVLSGKNTYSAGTIVNGGTAVFAENHSGSANFKVANGANLVFTNSTGSQTLSGGGITGVGNLIKQGADTTGNSVLMLGSGFPTAQTVALTNGLIWVQGGVLRNEWGNSAWGNNQAAVQVDNGAVFDVWDGTVTVDYLAGAGTINKGWSASKVLTIGVNNGSGNFSGVIENNRTDLGYGGQNGGTLSLVKIGTGTEILSGANTYVGSTTISNGTLVIGNPGSLGNGSYAAAILNNSTFVYGSSGYQTLSGVISGTGTLVVQGSGTLALSGANTYTGGTVISNGTLTLTGSLSSTNIVTGSGGTFDVSGISFSLGTGQALSGSGHVNGSVNTASGSKIYGGTDGTFGTNTINGNLTLAAGSACYLDLGNAYNGNNDQIVVNGTVTANNGVIHLKAPSAVGNLDTAGDYVLMTAGAISGTFAASPVWDVAPANARHYSIVTSGNTVTLHYSAVVAPILTASANLTSVLRNQSTTITATVNPGDGTITGVSVDLTAIGGSPVSLVLSNNNVYTNSITIPATALAGNAVLVVTATDSNSQNGSALVSLAINVSTDVWNGAGADNNLGTALNWTNHLAPGYVGDSLEFAGTTRLTPNVEANYMVAGITFDAGAGAFTIGSDDGSVLTLTNTGALVNNSTSVQTLNLPLADNGGGLTKSGNGTIVLPANNTYTGPTVVNGGTLSLSGSLSSSSNAVVGHVTGSAALNVSGTLSLYDLDLGAVTNANAAMWQSGGTITLQNAAYIGQVAGSYGYSRVDSGATFTANEIQVGAWGPSFGGNGGNAIFEVNGGTVTDNGWFVLTRGGQPQTDILNVYSGSLSYAGGGLVGNWGVNQTSIINVLGGVLSGNGIGMGWSANHGTFTVNLNGGLVGTSGISTNGGGTLLRLNFNGGTLQAANNANDFIPVTAATVYSGGATIDNNGNAVTINQPLLAPAGNGVYSASITSGGAGYIAPPIVTVTNGVGDTTGTGATAIAQINPASGTVTNVIITCPGVNYTATPVFVVSSGGAITPAVITGTAPTPNTSGGFTAIGSGVTVLAGANTYTGNTIVKAGTLELAQATLGTNSTVSITNRAMLQLDFSTTNQVASLVLNGVAQPAGVYSASTTPTYISGSGSLIVVPLVTGPGRFTSTPGITGFTLNGANVVLTVTDGQANDAYYLLSSTNVSLPINQWRTVATNVPGTSGTFTFTGTNVMLGLPQQFYLLSNTNYNP